MDMGDAGRWSVVAEWRRRGGTFDDLAVGLASGLGCGGVVVALGAPPSWIVLGVSGAPAARLDDLQQTLGVGPVVRALETHRMVVADLRTSDGGLLADGAASAGLSVAVAIPLRIGAATFGVLTIYHDTTVPPGPAEVAELEVVATLVAAAALDHLTGGHGAVQVVDSPDLPAMAVHQAAGMLAARFDIGVEQAYVRLRAMAYAHGCSLIEMAVEIVQRRIDPEG